MHPQFELGGYLRELMACLTKQERQVVLVARVQAGRLPRPNAGQKSRISRCGFQPRQNNVPRVTTTPPQATQTCRVPQWAITMCHVSPQAIKTRHVSPCNIEMCHVSPYRTSAPP